MAPHMTLRQVMKRVGGGHGKKGHGKLGGFSGLRPIRAKLFSTLFSSASGAASALTYASSVTLTTGNFPELSQFMVIYDELRMINVKIHYFPLVSTAATVAPFTTTAAFSLEFDPTAGAPTSAGSLLEATFSSNLMLVSAGVNGTTAQSINFHTKYLTLSGRAPKLAPIASSDCPGSAWIVLDSSTAPTMCVFLQYAAALGTTGIITNSWMVELDVEFRLRT